MSPVQAVSTRPPQRRGISRPAIREYSEYREQSKHGSFFDDELYDQVAELTLHQMANTLLKDGLRVFNSAEWNMDGAHRYTLLDNVSDWDDEAAAKENYHAEFLVVLPGMARDFHALDVPITWELRDALMREAYVAQFSEYPSVDDIPDNLRNVDLLTLFYVSEFQDWTDGEGQGMRKVVNLKPVRVKFYTPPPGYGYIAAKRFNAFIEMAVKNGATWLDGLFFKVEGEILGLNDKDDFNYVAEMTDFEAQSDAIEFLLVTPEELMPKIDTSEVRPDISPTEKRIDELEAIFESYMRTHPDAPKDYMTVSIIMGLSDEYYRLLEEFGEL